MSNWRGKAQQWIIDHLHKESDDCFLWPHNVLSTGYPVVQNNGKRVRAHRLMCMLAHGEPPAPRMDCAHSCGNKTCCNPRHLRWATRKENEADKVLHERDNQGKRNGQALLNEKQVLEICKKLDSGRERLDLADDYGVAEGTIICIDLGYNWNWLTNRKKERPKPKHHSEQKGVYWNNASKKWQAVIVRNKEKHFLGYFIEETDAIFAYQEAAKQLGPSHQGKVKRK